MPSAVKNVILMIGDGMGPNQLELTKHVTDTKRLAMESLDPSPAMMTTYSLDGVTDSAAAATAIATGYKTNNHWVGLLPDGSTPETILERAEAIGKSTGLVTDVSVYDATLAAFAAHGLNRYSEQELTDQIAAHESTSLPVEIGYRAVGRQVEAVDSSAVFGHERVVGNPRHRLTTSFHRTRSQIVVVEPGKALLCLEEPAGTPSAERLADAARSGRCEAGSHIGGHPPLRPRLQESFQTCRPLGVGIDTGCRGIGKAQILIDHARDLMSDCFGWRARRVGEDDNRQPILDISSDRRPEALPRAAVFDQSAPALFTQRPAESVRVGDAVAE